jgi:DNA-binding transcriptional MerR regulator
MTNTIPVYNLKAVILETGLNPATLRAWERRYGFLKPQRSPGGQRIYSEQDITLLKWVMARQAEGLSISRAIQLWRNQEESRTQESLSTGPAVGAEGTRLDEARQQWIAACLRFDEAEAERTLSQAFALTAPEVICIEVLQKGLAEIGARWAAGAVSVQQEHFASALLVRRLNALLAVAPRPSRPGRLLAACPPGEEHDLALLMLTFILRWGGWEVIYLGANVPLDQWDATLRVISPHLVLSVAQTLPGAASLIELAEFAKAQSMPLAYGGGIFNHIPGLAGRIPGHFLGRQVDGAPQVIEHLLSSQPSPPASRPLPPAYIAALGGFRENEAPILAKVRQILQTSPIDPRYVEAANTHFTRAVVAALVLGEINYLDYSVEWLNGLLDNYGLSPTSAVQYYQAFHQAVQEQPGLQAIPVLEWLSRFEKTS